MIPTQSLEQSLLNQTSTKNDNLEEPLTPAFDETTPDGAFLEKNNHIEITGIAMVSNLESMTHSYSVPVSIKLKIGSFVYSKTELMEGPGNSNKFVIKLGARLPSVCLLNNNEETAENK